MNRLVKVRGFDDEVGGGGGVGNDKIDDFTFSTG